MGSDYMGDWPIRFLLSTFIPSQLTFLDSDYGAGFVGDEKKSTADVPVALPLEKKEHLK